MATRGKTPDFRNRAWHHRDHFSMDDLRRDLRQVPVGLCLYLCDVLCGTCVGDDGAGVPLFHIADFRLRRRIQLRDAQHQDRIAAGASEKDIRASTYFTSLTDQSVPPRADAVNVTSTSAFTPHWSRLQRSSHNPPLIGVVT